MFTIIISNATEKLNCRKKMAFALSTLKYIHIDRKFIIHKILSKLVQDPTILLLLYLLLTTPKSAMLKSIQRNL